LGILICERGCYLGIIYKPKVKIVALVLATIISCLAFYFAENSTNALEVQENGKIIAYVKEKSLVFELKDKEEAALKNRFINVSCESDIRFRAVRIDASKLSTKEELSNGIREGLKGYVKGVSIKSSEGEIGSAATTKEATDILHKVRDYYIGESGIKTSEIEEIILKDKIYIEESNIQIASVKSPEVTVENIINAAKEKPTVSFQIKGVKNSDEEVTYLDSTLIDSKKVTISNLNSQGAIAVSSGNKLSFKVPVVGKITSQFGMRWGKMHDGIDIAANYGVAIYAALSGKVAYSGWESGYGNFIIINHGGNLESCYGHCSKITVPVGTTVKKGDKIGEIGSTGNSTGPHLHFEIRYNGKAQNPCNYLNFSN
jgi:murein DD-endopeptidase MepM/ murein hydrolase activator NlpD